MLQDNTGQTCMQNYAVCRVRLQLPIILDGEWFPAVYRSTTVLH